MKKAILKPVTYGFCQWDGENEEDIKIFLKEAKIALEFDKTIIIENSLNVYGYFWIIPESHTIEHSVEKAVKIPVGTIILKSSKDGKVFFMSPEHFANEYVEIGNEEDGKS